MFKKAYALIILFSCLFLICEIANAKVIALDNQNPDQCRQQILHGGDTQPIIFVYLQDCVWAKKLLPVYEEVSNEMPNRAFFTFEFSGSDGLDYLKAKTAQDCLGTIPIFSPTVYVYNVEISAIPSMQGNIFGPQSEGLNGASTKQDVINFVNGRSTSSSANKAYTNIMQTYAHKN